MGDYAASSGNFLPTSELVWTIWNTDKSLAAARIRARFYQPVAICYTDWTTPASVQERRYIGCPTTYQTQHFFNNSKTNEDIATKQAHTTDTFLFISHTTNVLLFKSRCNIFIGFRIIKEMPGLVGSGTSCVIANTCYRSYNVLEDITASDTAYVVCYNNTHVCS